MPSKVLALKYRPKDFSEVVGQETTVQILQNALVQKHLHHAYLFTGPRGIGKTSLARIFSRALNCAQGPTDHPCNQCTSCLEVSEGRSLSVIEIDGASNTSVDDVRDLREKIRYLPPGGRYKIYIIDEVHMLSTAAFNALLKTLEEPPPHAIFLFATTEPQKVPATVLSRMIRFDLRPISRSAIIDHLRNIAKVESIPIRDEALFEIAREAQGGLRDALSLLDQIISFSGSEITLASVEGVIGVSTRRFILQMIEAILNQDASKTLMLAEDAFSSGIEVKRLSLDLLEYTRHLLVAQINQDPSLFNLPQEEITHLANLAKLGTSDELDRLFRVLQRGVSELIRSPQAKILMDVLCVRACHFKDLYSTDEILKMIGNAPKTQTIPVSRPSSAPVQTQRQQSDAPPPVREQRESKTG
ncbi:MAG: DNA polymerase III subunit gamma/tau [Deltaproteobacteria bacterium]|nr:DNA polymerase III subunit gamma/tau [Deltaproteobacteria bacterium]